MVNYTGDIDINSPQFSAAANKLGFHGTEDVHLLNDQILLDTEQLNVYAGHSVNLTSKDQVYEVYDLYFDSTIVTMKSANNIQVKIDKPIILADFQNDILTDDFITYTSKLSTTNIGSDKGENSVLAERIHIGTQPNYPPNTSNINFTAKDMVFQSDNLSMQASQDLQAKAGWMRFGQSGKGNFNLYAKNNFSAKADIAFSINTNPNSGPLDVEAPAIKLAAGNQLAITLREGNLNDIRLRDCNYCGSDSYLAQDLRSLNGTLHQYADTITNPAIQLADEAVKLAGLSYDKYIQLAEQEDTAWEDAKQAYNKAVTARALAVAAREKTKRDCSHWAGGYSCPKNAPPSCQDVAPTWVTKTCYTPQALPAPVPPFNLSEPSSLEEKDIPITEPYNRSFDDLKPAGM